MLRTAVSIPYLQERFLPTSCFRGTKCSLKDFRFPRGTASGAEPGCAATGCVFGDNSPIPQTSLGPCCCAPPPSPSAGSWSHGCPGGGVSIGEPNATTDPHRLVANPKAVRQGGRWAHASPFLPPAWLGPAGHPGRCHLRSPFARTVSPIAGQTNKQASLTSFRFLPGHPGTAAGGDHGAEGSEVAGGRGARSPGAELIPPAAGQEAPSRHGPTGHLIPPPLHHVPVGRV